MNGVGWGTDIHFYSRHQKKKKENEYQVFKLINGLVSVWMVQWTDKQQNLVYLEYNIFDIMVLFMKSYDCTDSQML